MAEKLEVKLREDHGTRKARRLRKAGFVPAVLYGHRRPNVHLMVPAHDLEAVIRHGARVVRLVGAVEEQALIREVQWDTWGLRIQHVDFARVSGRDRVRVTVPVELRGESPGVKHGGMLEHLIHQVELECEATEVPDRLVVSINELDLNQSITLGQLSLPKSGSIVGDPDQIVVRCVMGAEEVEEAVAAAPEREPELIRRKPEAERETEEEGEED